MIRQDRDIGTDGNGKEVQHHIFFFGARREKHRYRRRLGEADAGSEHLFLLFMYIVYMWYTYTLLKRS